MGVGKSTLALCCRRASSRLFDTTVRLNGEWTNANDFFAAARGRVRRIDHRWSVSSLIEDLGVVGGGGHFPRRRRAARPLLSETLQHKTSWSICRFRGSASAPSQNRRGSPASHAVRALGNKGGEHKATKNKKEEGGGGGRRGGRKKGGEIHRLPVSHTAIRSPHGGVHSLTCFGREAMRNYPDRTRPRAAYQDADDALPRAHRSTTATWTRQSPPDLQRVIASSETAREVRESVMFSVSNR